MSPGYLFILFLGIFFLALLFWMLIPVNTASAPEEKARSKCPICSHPLQKGERLRSDIMEIGDVEVHTRIKGCPFCYGGKNAKRSCPICKNLLEGEEAILAVSYPKIDSRKLSIRGCKKCYPQGFS